MKLFLKYDGIIKKEFSNIFYKDLQMDLSMYKNQLNLNIRINGQLISSAEIKNLSIEFKNE